jgi:hypothetical protein
LLLQEHGANIRIIFGIQCGKTEKFGKKLAKKQKKFVNNNAQERMAELLMSKFQMFVKIFHKKKGTPEQCILEREAGCLR